MQTDPTLQNNTGTHDFVNYSPYRNMFKTEVIGLNEIFI
jgi:hypothetical protein